MTNFISLLRKSSDISSVVWHESVSEPGVRFAIKRISLERRIEFTRRIRDLTLKNEFLRAGTLTDQLEASLADLLVMRLYLDWGLADIKGIRIDGQPATADSLAEKGPESLSKEIVLAIRAEAELSEDERKN